MASKAKAWHQVARLRDDVKSGELTMSMFAADLDEVMLRKGRRPMYEDPAQFFSLTYPTYNLRALARDVVRRLAGKSDKAVRQLTLTYGGGKTHTLITLFHLVTDPDALPELPAVEEFRAAIDLEDGLPRARVAAISFDKLDLETGIEVADPNGETRHLFHPWSVVAWQLAGREGLEVLNGGKGGRERETAPAENVMMELLALPGREGRSVLILLDEVLMYARQRVVEGEGWMAKLQTFFQALTQAAVKTDRCAVVASLLASDVDFQDKQGMAIINQLKDVFSRQQEEPVEPVVKEDVAEVLRRRFFTPESILDKDALRPHALAAFKGVQEHDAATRKAGQVAEKRFVDSFPFHPDLTDAFYSKWVQLDQFQRTRGVLRIFAMALRDAAAWDTGLVVGPNVFLRERKEEGLSDAVRELVQIADSQAKDGSKTAWAGILDRELMFAREIERDLTGLKQREVEQAVLSVFFHSQPTGMKVGTRELTLLLATGNPDRIELHKGLARWAAESYWLDDQYTAVDAGKLPETWRMGNKPNLTQIHREKRRQMESQRELVDSRLLDMVKSQSRLTSGAGGFGVRVHTLPEVPNDVEDDGKFHFAVMGPEAAGESGKPSTEAVRFLNETTGPAKPRVYRNAVVLLTPGRDGLEQSRAAVADLLAWEQVGSELHEQQQQGSVDAQRLQRLAVELDRAKKRTPEAIRQAWSIVVTVGRDNHPHAFKLKLGDEPIFATIKNDDRSRLQDSQVSAESLLPEGPYDLWKQGETFRRVKDLSRAFAQLPHLPKMLNADAILDTLVDGCVAGEFVLKLTRPDRSVRTWWRRRPDDEALRDPDLEVVLTPHAELVELPPGLLSPGGAPGLWKGDTVTLADIEAYFGGGTVVRVDKGTHEEPQEVPKAVPGAVEAAVKTAVAEGNLWLISGQVSLYREEVPPGILTADSQLRGAPEPVRAVDLLPAVLENAWEDEKANAAGFQQQLSAKQGLPLPWTLIEDAINMAMTAGFLKQSSPPDTWPCNPGQAQHAHFQVTQTGATKRDTGQTRETQFTHKAPVTASQIQDIGDQIADLIKIQQEHNLDLNLYFELNAGTKDTNQELSEEAKAAIREWLDGVGLGG